MAGWASTVFTTITLCRIITPLSSLILGPPRIPRRTPTPPVYATSQMGLNPVKQEEVASRPSPMSMSSYPSIPVSAPSLVSGSNYSTSTAAAAPPSYPAPEMLSMQHDMPRTTFEHPPTYTTASSMSNFAPASYAPLSYAPSLHNPHPDRRISHA